MVDFFFFFNSNASHLSNSQNSRIPFKLTQHVGVGQEGLKVWSDSRHATYGFLVLLQVDLHAISDAPEGHVSGSLCILYKETFSVIQLGITLQRPTPKRWWKLSFLNID